jgi:uncharacterized damage-inducible protein DinB
MSPKEQFLAQYDREHATTMRVLRAYPTDKLDLKPAPMLKSAKELAWLFVAECGLGQMEFADAFGRGAPPGERPTMPDTWDGILAALQSAHKGFADTIRAMSDEQLNETVKFFTAPKQLGDVTRMQFAWFLLHDEIHHRGQFSIYLRMAGGIVPSIYGPTHEEPWM